MSIANLFLSSPSIVDADFRSSPTNGLENYTCDFSEGEANLDFDQLFNTSVDFTSGFDSSTSSFPGIPFPSDLVYVGEDNSPETTSTLVLNSNNSHDDHFRFDFSVDSSPNFSENISQSPRTELLSEQFDTLNLVFGRADSSSIDGHGIQGRQDTTINQLSLPLLPPPPNNSEETPLDLQSLLLILSENGIMDPNSDSNVSLPTYPTLPALPSPLDSQYSDYGNPWAMLNGLPSVDGPGGGEMLGNFSGDLQGHNSIIPEFGISPQREVLPSSAPSQASLSFPDIDVTDLGCAASDPPFVLPPESELQKLPVRARRLLKAKYKAQMLKPSRRSERIAVRVVPNKEENLSIEEVRERNKKRKLEEEERRKAKREERERKREEKNVLAQTQAANRWIKHTRMTKFDPSHAELEKKADLVTIPEIFASLNDDVKYKQDRFYDKPPSRRHIMGRYDLLDKPLVDGMSTRFIEEIYYIEKRRLWMQKKEEARKKKLLEERTKKDRATDSKEEQSNLQVAST